MKDPESSSDKDPESSSDKDPESDLERALRAATQTRLDRGDLSANALAKSAGMSHAQLLRFLDRSRNLRLPAAGRLAAVLGLKLK